MANTEWSSVSWSFLRRVEERAATLEHNEQKASALVAAADFVPRLALWRLWPILLLLTISGVHVRYRNMRIELAGRVARFLSPDELLTLSVQQLRLGNGSGYLRGLLVGRPGDCWSRLRYPLEFSCGQLLDRPRAEAARLLELCASHTAVNKEGSEAVQPLPHQVDPDRIQAAWQAAREALSHPDCTDAIRATLRARVCAACVG